MHDSPLTESDRSLVARAREGDPRAFGVLATRHRAVAHRAASRILRDEHRTEDIVQDALLQAYQHLDGFEERSAFRSWFFRVVTNAALMERRRVVRHPEEALSESPAEADAFADRQRSVEGIVADRELALLAASAVRELPEPAKSLFIRSALERTPIAEIAREHALSVDAAKTCLSRTRRALRKALANAVEGSELAAPLRRANRASY